MCEIAPVDRCHWKHDQDVDGVELVIDDRAFADVAAKAQIALYPVSYTHLTLPTNREV